MQLGPLSAGSSHFDLKFYYGLRGATPRLDRQSSNAQMFPQRQNTS